MFATSLALLASAFQGADRGTAFGLWGATTGAAVAIGPLVGGALTEGFGWEFIFFINVPIGIGAIALTLAKVDESHAPSGGRIDWPGLVTFSGGLFCLIFALIRGNAEGWSSGLIVGLLAAARDPARHVRLVEARRSDAMLDLSLFRSPTFNGASLAAFALSASMFAMFLYLTLYIQNALGYGALEAGLRFLPVTLLSFARRARLGQARAALRRALVHRGRARAGRPRAAADAHDRAGGRVDRAAGRLHGRRRRHRPGQPRARHRGDQRGRAAARRHGLRHQLDVPAGRHRHRHRRARRGLRPHRQRAGGAFGAAARRAGLDVAAAPSARASSPTSSPSACSGGSGAASAVPSPGARRSSRACTRSCSTAGSSHWSPPRCARG